MIDKEEIYRLNKVSEAATDKLWKAWTFSCENSIAQSEEYLNLAKGHIQALHEALFPEQYNEVTSEVAAQNRANEVKHEMD